MNVRLLTLLHIISLVLLAMQIAVYKLWELTLRGTITNLLIPAVVFITGALLFFAARNRVGVAYKIYLWLYALSSPIWVLAWFTFSGQPTYISNGQYTIHGETGFLNPAMGRLYRNNFIFKKFIARVDDMSIEHVLEWEDLKIIGPEGEETGISVEINGRDTSFLLKPRNY